jgi:hypothetical protein
MLLLPLLICAQLVDLGPKPKHFLSVLALFKDENEMSNLREWIEHYRWQGVDHFYLIDNGNTKSYEFMLSPYIDRGEVEVVVDNTTAEISNRGGSQQQLQVLLYNRHYLAKLKAQSAWVLVCDVDEFAYARLPFRTIPDYLRQLQQRSPIREDGKCFAVTAVTMPWKTFGSSGFDRQPRGHVRESFVRRCDIPQDNEGVYQLGKTISRCDSLQWIFPHTTVAVDADFPECEPTHIMADGRRNARYPYQKVQHWDDGRFERKMGSLSVFTRASQESAALALNHYSVQSVEFNDEVKARRGNSNGLLNVYFRVQNKTKFHLQCSNTADRELAQAVNKSSWVEEPLPLF